MLIRFASLQSHNKQSTWKISENSESNMLLHVLCFLLVFFFFTILLCNCSHTTVASGGQSLLIRSPSGLMGSIRLLHPRRLLLMHRRALDLHRSLWFPQVKLSVEDKTIKRPPYYYYYIQFYSWLIHSILILEVL